MKRKILASLMVLGLLLAACAPAAAPTATPKPPPTKAPPTAVPPTAAPPSLGTAEMPIVLSMVPSGDTEEILQGGEEITALLAEKTDLVFDVNVATSYAAVIEAMGAEKAHMATLATFSYLLAHEKYGVDCALVSVRYGSPFYKGQIIAGADTGIEEVADIAGKTMCWVDATSTSGYIVPRVVLQAAGVNPETDLAQQVEAGSHNNVVLSVYRGDCDAGATYVDARGSVADQFADVNDKVVVIAESAEIPNDGLQFIADFPADLRAQIVQAFVDIMGTEEGVAAMQKAYQWSEVVEKDDTFYDGFRATLGAAGVDIADLDKTPPITTIDCMGAEGAEVTMLYQWSGAEEEKLNAVLKPAVDACGLKVVAQSTRDAAVLDTKAKSEPPDVLFWPTTAPLTLYTDQLQALDSLGAFPGNYAGYWQDMGSVGGEWLAAPAKADIKTIIWYSPANFELFGYTVPTTWQELEDLVEQMVADGNVPWSMGMESGAATGWTGSDFIQDILLVQQGPQYVLDVISGDVAYDDAGVQQAYETYGMWAADETYTVGGATGTVSTGFLDAIYKVFADPPEAMMVKQSGFAGGEVAKQYPDLEYGVDYDFFAVPGAQGMQGGADFMMAFGDSAATKAVIAYLTGPAGAAEWAKVGFDLSPNKLAIGHYTDAALVKKAAALAGAAGFTPDIGDSIPAPFGEAEWKAIVDFVQGADVATALAGAATAQADALQ
jgi:alpha-glucoside transport system substrate-binding protein